MKELEFVDLLKKGTPDVPWSYHERVEETLQMVINHKETVNKSQTRMGNADYSANSLTFKEN